MRIFCVFLVGASIRNQQVAGSNPASSSTKTGVNITPVFAVKYLRFCILEDLNNGTDFLLKKGPVP